MVVHKVVRISDDKDNASSYKVKAISSRNACLIGSIKCNRKIRMYKVREFGK
ncbi:MAG: hypothetical protein JWP78_840 [Mucilaginibacter sp.]|nr:hypothetical protein [Mucilaginibacter sp.]